jgi:hypothetical protein
VLYALAANKYSAEEEAAILAATREGRVGATRAAAICERLKLPAPPNGNDDAAAENAEAEDTEIQKILDGPPPAVPPPAPVALPNVALPIFDQAVSKLKQLVTKTAADFDGTVHSTDDLEKVERLSNSKPNSWHIFNISCSVRPSMTRSPTLRAYSIINCISIQPNP